MHGGKLYGFDVDDILIWNNCTGIMWEVFCYAKIVRRLMKIMDWSRKRGAFHFWMKDVLSSESLRSKGMILG